MDTNGVATYPDTTAVLAQLAEENPPAHIAAQRLAALHIDMAQATHDALEDLSQAFAILATHVDAKCSALQKEQSADSAKIQRSLQGFRQAIEMRTDLVEQAVAGLREGLGRRGKHRVRWQIIGAALGGALGGMLALAALWLALGQTVHVHMLAQPQANEYQKGK